MFLLIHVESGRTVDAASSMTELAAAIYGRTGKLMHEQTEYKIVSEKASKR